MGINDMTDEMVEKFEKIIQNLIEQKLIEDRKRKLKKIMSNINERN